MGLFMKENGYWEELMVMGNLFILREKFMRAIGKMIKHMDMAYTFIRMELNMMGSGNTICKMAKVRRLGQMGQSLKASMLMEKRTE